MAEKEEVIFERYEAGSSFSHAFILFFSFFLKKIFWQKATDTRYLTSPPHIIASRENVSEDEF
jgi:hypothetical protein